MAENPSEQPDPGGMATDGLPFSEAAMSRFIEDTAIIERWATGASGLEQWPIEPGSSLANDDVLTRDGDLMSHQVTSLLHASLDNLHGVKVAVIDGQVIHTYAEYPAIRSSIEAAAMAWWLLENQSRNVRATRSTQLFWHDSCDLAKALAVVGRQPDGRLEKHRKVLETRIGISTHVATRPLSITRVMKGFGEQHRDIPAQMVWQASSGMAHGRRWAMTLLSDLDPAEDPTPDQPGGLFRVSGNADNIGMCYHAACLTLETALTLFHKRRTRANVTALGLPVTVTP